jgi:hypothetical protein
MFLMSRAVADGFQLAISTVTEPVSVRVIHSNVLHVVSAMFAVVHTKTISVQYQHSREELTTRFRGKAFLIHFNYNAAFHTAPCSVLKLSIA